MAKNGDAAALACLCQSFAPLIFKLSHRQTVYAVFGEDAENTAWMLFLEFIHAYQGDDYAKLPGLVRKFMIHRFMNLMEHYSLRYKLEQLSNLGEASKVALLPARDCFWKALTNIALKQELKLLPSRQYEVLKEFYLRQQKIEQISAKLHMSPRTVRHNRQMALTTLRKNLRDHD